MCHRNLCENIRYDELVVLMTAIRRSTLQIFRIACSAVRFPFSLRHHLREKFPDLVSSS